MTPIEPGHPSDDELQGVADGIRQSPHVDRCARCSGEVERYRGLFAHLATQAQNPIPTDFTQAVLARVDRSQRDRQLGVAIEALAAGAALAICLQQGPLTALYGIARSALNALGHLGQAAATVVETVALSGPLIVLSGVATFALLTPLWRLVNRSPLAFVPEEHRHG